MIAVDTNVLVRYITNDDKEQALLATTLLDSYIGKEKSIFINNIVLCELVWVLVRGYKYQKEDIIKTLKLLLSSVEFEFENHELAFLAVIEYEEVPVIKSVTINDPVIITLPEISSVALTTGSLLGLPMPIP